MKGNEQLNVLGDVFQQVAEHVRFESFITFSD